MSKAKKNLPAVHHSAETPAYFQGLKSQDTTSTIGQGDVSVARLKIIQALSKAKDLIEGIKEGDFYNTISSMSYGNSVRFFVMLRYKSRIWFDEDGKFLGTEQQNLICQNGKLILKGMVHFGPKVEDCLEKNYEEGSDCDNFLVVFEDDLLAAMELRQMPEVLIYSCMNASRKPARQLNSKIAINATKGIPIFGQLVRVETIKENFPKGAAFMPKFSFDRFATAKEAGMLDEFFPFAVRMSSRQDLATTAKDEQ